MTGLASPVLPALQNSLHVRGSVKAALSSADTFKERTEAFNALRSMFKANFASAVLRNNDPLIALHGFPTNNLHVKQTLQYAQAYDLYPP